MDIIKAKQFRAFSAQYGTIVGLFWILSFSCYIIGLGHPLVANLGFLFGICSIFVAGYLIRHFRRNVFGINPRAGQDTFHFLQRH